MKRSCVCAFLFVSLCCALSGSGLSTSEPENDLALSETFLREAPSRLEQYTLQGKQLQGSILMEYTGTLHGLKGRTYDELRMNDSAKLNLHSSERSIRGKVDLQYSTVVGVNPEYAFYLRSQLHVFLDDAGLRETVLTVHGTVAPATKTK